MTVNKVFNILHVATKLPVGGVENMLLKVVRSYDKKRFNVSVCCIKEGGEIADRLRELGYKVDILDGMKGHGLDLRALVSLYRLIKKRNIHILRTHQYHANLYGRIAGLLANVPVIIPSYHCRYKSREEPKIHRRILNYFLSFFSDALVAVSNAVASDIVKYDKVTLEKIKVVYNGIATEAFSADMFKHTARTMLNLPAASLIVGTLGRLEEDKDQMLPLRAASKIPNMTVAIAGDGPLRNEMEEFARRNNISSFFMGRISPENVPVFLKSIDLFCFPSLWEGFGTAIVEAMASGLPVVASDIPPHREILGDSGILFPPGDESELARVLGAIINDTAQIETVGKKARERAQLFTIENTVKAYEDIFIEVLSRKGLT